MIVLISLIYTASCEQKKAVKLEMLSTTREQLGNAERAVMECNQAVQQIDAEIAKLRELIVQKKVTDLRACKGAFDNRITLYKTMYKSAHGREPSDTHISEMKRRLGITI